MTANPTHNGDTRVLTDTKLRRLKARDAVYRIADSNGLAIEVRATGAKFWRYRYRYAGKPTMLTLGEYPSIGLADARAARDKARSHLRGGANPLHVAQAERAAIAERTENTFGAIADELLEKRAREGLGLGSVKRERRLIDKDLAGIKNILIDGFAAPSLLTALRNIEARGTIEEKARMATKKAAPAKKSEVKVATAKPIKEALTNSGLIAHLAEVSEVSANDVRAVLSALEGAMSG